MKLVIQIPCYNEETTLPLVFEKLPRVIEGIDEVAVLVIDDGSTDRTSEVAARLGADHIVRIDGPNRRWLGRAFARGIDFALAIGADIVVNTDGDNQYPSEKVPELIRPIIERRAGIVIGDRRPEQWREFTPAKRSLQRAGNDLLSAILGHEVRDAVSGFRAYSRDALLKLNIITDYSYTIDTLMQAYKKGVDVEWVAITPNPKTRESHLEPRTHRMVLKGAEAILRLLTVYEPFKVFVVGAALFLVPAVIALGRFLYFFFFVHEEAAGHIQSVIFGGAFLVIGVTLAVFGVVAGLLGVNRRLIEDVLRRVRRLELAHQSAADVQAGTAIAGGGGNAALGRDSVPASSR